MERDLRLASCILVFVVALPSAAASLPSTVGEFNHPGTPLARSSLFEGEVLALGSVANGACSFAATPISISTSSPPDGVMRWTAVRFDASNCTAVVAGLWRGVFDPLRDRSAASADVKAVFVEAPRGEAATPLLQPGVISPPCPNAAHAYQHVYMYGWGGTGDKLTHDRGYLDYCSDGTQVKGENYDHTCAGSDHGSWTWVVDACPVSYKTSGWVSHVYAEGYGDFHCSPRNVAPCSFDSTGTGYSHTLWDDEEAFPDGHSTCTYGYDGHIVAGVSAVIVAGCS